MKLLGVLLLCAFVAAVPTAVEKIDIGLDIPDGALETEQSRNFLINAVIRQLFTFIRHFITNGSPLIGIPPLDPLTLEEYRLYLPLGLVNLDLDLHKALISGIGGFVVHSSNFIPRQLSFEVDISVPSLEVSAEGYDLVGDMFAAIPVYGKGQARFQVDDFRLRGTIILKQSEDGKSVLIDKVINSSYVIPFFKSELTGVIGGGPIDDVVNAVLEDVIIDYANRFQAAIAALVSHALPVALNPILGQLDTWKYIAMFV